MKPETGTHRWFRPPRPHGEVLEDRSVGFLELFYDLVFVVLIAQLSHTLAEDITWIGVRNFVIVFGLIWIAWINGTLYHDLHGGDDGRSRTYIFAQMSVLALLAVFAGHGATDPSDGRGFAIVYTVLLVVIGWQWFDVRRFDTPEWRAIAGQYVQGMALVGAIAFASALVGNQDVRVMLWALAVGLTLIGNLVVILRPRNEMMAEAIRPSESLVERFGLFIIIVLGEVVVGVANGVSAADHNFLTMTTGLLSLWIGFGFWWNYFDFVGGREPLADQRPRATWFFAHLPLAISVSAAGAGMVGLIEHASDGRTPAPTAWLIGGATAGVAVSIAILATAIEPHPARRFVPYSLLAAAVASLAIAAARPAPWMLAFALSGLMSLVWAESFVRHKRHGVIITDRV